MPKFEIDKDGSFVVDSGGSRLKCYPGINWERVRPVSVRIGGNSEEGRIDYELPDGVLSIELARDEDCLCIRTSLTTEVPVDWLHPVFEAELQGVSGVYCQGIGMAGPSGYQKIEEARKKGEPQKSYALIGLDLEEGKGLVLRSDNHSSLLNEYRTSCKFSEQDPMDTLSAGFRIERVGRILENVPEIRIQDGGSLQSILASSARSIAKVMGARRVHEPSYHWCSWYYLYQNFSQTLLEEYLEGFSKIEPRLPLQYIQIDAGYFPAVGDWLEHNELWPGGLEKAFATIREAGYKPAIWIGPFMVGNRSRVFREHPDWILRDLEGNPVVTLECYLEERLWGYQDEEILVLDTSHPEAMEYIRNVFRTLKGWGAEFFKTDFILWGLFDSAKVRRHVPGKTSYEYLSEFFDMVREQIGDDAYWLGCIAPFGPMIGRVDGMRIASDVQVVWNERAFGSRNMMQECSHSSYFNHVFWHNDPDALFLRDFHTKLSAMEKESLSLMQAITGGTIYSSDPLHEVGEEAIETFRFLAPRGSQSVDMPFMTDSSSFVVMRREWKEEGRVLVLVVNPLSESRCEILPLDRLVDGGRAYVSRWKQESGEERIVDTLNIRLSSHESALFFLSVERLPDSNPSNMWEW